MWDNLPASYAATCERGTHHQRVIKPLQYLPSGASGDWAITGGVGSIGLLTAHWVAAAGHAGLHVAAEPHS